MLFCTWVAGAGRGPARLLVEMQSLGDAALSPGVRGSDSWSSSSVLNGRISGKHFQMDHEAGSGILGFSTLSVRSSLKEDIDYIKGSTLPGVRFEPVRRKVTPLKKLADFFCHFMVFE